MKLLYFEAIFSNCIMSWQKPKQLYLFPSLLENKQLNLACKTSMGSSRNCSFLKPSLAIALCYSKSLTTTVFVFISIWKWIGKSSFCKLCGFFLNLLYFEAIYGNLWKKLRQLFFYISNSIFTSLLEDGRENSKEILQTPPLPPGGVQSMINLSGDHPGARTFPTTPHMTLTLSWFLIPLFP